MRAGGLPQPSQSAGTSVRRSLQRWAVGSALGFMLCAGTVHATPIPFEERQVDMTVREQPIAAFLQDFFGTMDVPVSVSANVKGAVNGVFRGPTERVFANIQKSFGLMAYYDGSVVHIYTPSEVTTRTFAMRQGDARLSPGGQGEPGAVE